MFKCCEKKGLGVSLLVPRSPGIDEGRDLLWDWLRQYWKAHLPYAEIVGGRDAKNLSQPGRTFSKTTAVNDAAGRATGDIFVILDSDAYVAPDIITTAASEIRLARKRDRRLWFIPYRRFYRLNHDLTEHILTTDPRLPQLLDDPMPRDQLDPIHGNSPQYGHHYAAMIMVFPREAFEELGGMDVRFIGWGGEDISFMRALDTVYNNHKTMDRAVYHLFHQTHGLGVNRQWTGQLKRTPFTILGARYQAAYGDRARMLRLNNEWRNGMMKVHPNIDASSILNPDVIPEEIPAVYTDPTTVLPVHPDDVDLVVPPVSEGGEDDLPTRR